MYLCMCECLGGSSFSTLLDICSRVQPEQQKTKNKLNFILKLDFFLSFSSLYVLFTVKCSSVPVAMQKFKIFHFCIHDETIINSIKNLNGVSIGLNAIIIIKYGCDTYSLKIVVRFHIDRDFLLILSRISNHTSLSIDSQLSHGHAIKLSFRRGFHILCVFFVSF